jgi:hypothetical protein
MDWSKFDPAELLPQMWWASQSQWIDQLDGDWTGGLPLNSTSLALEASRTVKSGAGSLFGLTITNTNASAQWVLLFNLQTVPANGAVPVTPIRVPGTTTMGVLYGLPPRFFNNGICVANSSTSATLTIGAADCWFDCQYL